MHVFWALAVASIINGKIYQPCKQFWILQNYDLKFNVGLYAVLDDMGAAMTLSSNINILRTTSKICQYESN